jgi:N utilization substance protein A
MVKRKRREREGLGSDSAGQSGDTQQLSNVADADSESVEELAEEGNAFEAEAVEGVEDAKDPDVSEVTTHEVAEDDVPPEYLNDQNNDAS